MLAWQLGLWVVASHADAGDARGRALVERFMLVADTFLEVEVLELFISYGLAPLLPVARPSAIGRHATDSLKFFIGGGRVCAHAVPLQALCAASCTASGASLQPWASGWAYCWHRRGLHR